MEEDLWLRSSEYTASDLPRDMASTVKQRWSPWRKNWLEGLRCCCARSVSYLVERAFAWFACLLLQVARMGNIIGGFCSRLRYSIFACSRGWEGDEDPELSGKGWDYLVDSEVLPAFLPPSPARAPEVIVPCDTSPPMGALASRQALLPFHHGDLGATLGREVASLPAAAAARGHFESRPLPVPVMFVGGMAKARTPPKSSSPSFGNAHCRTGERGFEDDEVPWPSVRSNLVGRKEYSFHRQHVRSKVTNFEGDGVSSSSPATRAGLSLNRWLQEGKRFRLSDGCKLVLHRGDITKWHVDRQTDAIVNAANVRMLGGGGVDGAIHSAAGGGLLHACRQIPEIRRGVRCPTGEARITSGFKLPVAKVIHTVGPVYHESSHPEQMLASAYKNSCALAIKEGLKYIAFPAISCGIYGYPVHEAATIALTSVLESSGTLEEVHFVLYELGIYHVWQNEAESRLGSIE